MNCAVQSKYQNLYSIDIIQREDTIFQNHVTQNTSFPMCMILIIDILLNHIWLDDYKYEAIGVRGIG